MTWAVLALLSLMAIAAGRAGTTPATTPVHPVAIGNVVPSLLALSTAVVPAEDGPSVAPDGTIRPAADARWYGDLLREITQRDPATWSSAETDYVHAVEALRAADPQAALAAGV